MYNAIALAAPWAILGKSSVNSAVIRASLLLHIFISRTQTA